MGRNERERWREREKTERWNKENKADAKMVSMAQSLLHYAIQNQTYKCCEIITEILMRFMSIFHFEYRMHRNQHFMCRSNNTAAQMLVCGFNCG